jgi:hypothetical protein
MFPPRNIGSSAPPTPTRSGATVLLSIGRRGKRQQRELQQTGQYQRGQLQFANGTSPGTSGCVNGMLSETRLSGNERTLPSMITEALIATEVQRSIASAM